jgi:phenylpyruvate tautomerase PptA (4-oxalocrotonate tautomerase family)
MPHIRVRSVSTERLIGLRAALVDELTAAVGCERSWFTLEAIPTAYIGDAGIEPGNPFVEVLWFRRSKAIRAQVARILHERLKDDRGLVTVVFRDLASGDYFENGEPV